MARIGFIGLGNMGLPMAQNLIKAGHQVEGVDVNPAAVEKLKAAGGVAVDMPAVAAARADVVITMLPSGKEVREVYLGPGGIVESTNEGTLLIDCSTIDVESARAVAAAAEAKGLMMLDAPVSGGVGGATAGTLTFMVGGSERAFVRAEPILQHHGEEDRACRRRRQRPGRQDLQQHDPRHFHDRGVGSLRAGREARARPSEAVRHFLERVGPVLGDDQPLSGARPGADFGRQSRLPGRFHGGDDAEGSELIAGRRARRPARIPSSAPPRQSFIHAMSKAARRAGTIQGSFAWFADSPADRRCARGARNAPCNDAFGAGGGPRSERSVTRIALIDMVNASFTVANKPNLYGVI